MKDYPLYPPQNYLLGLSEAARETAGERSVEQKINQAYGSGMQEKRV